MGRPAAKLGDRVMGMDVHIVLRPTPAGPVPTPTPLPFAGTITGNCSPNVLIGGMPAATVGSIATNNPPHIPAGGVFLNPPTNLGTVLTGSATVFINNRPAARAGDTVHTCNDPAPAPTSTVIAIGAVLLG